MHKSHAPIILFIMMSPLYFKNEIGLQIPLIGFIFCFLYLINAIIRNKESILLIIIYLIFSLIQYLFLNSLEYDAFLRKMVAVIVFIGTFYIFFEFYNEKYDKYFLAALVFVILYGIFSAFSYAFSYDEYLIPGTCAATNLSNFGLLRCATFGEGNYLGGYIALTILIFSRYALFMWLSLLGILIAWSPIPALVYIYALSKLLIVKYDVAAYKYKAAIILFSLVFVASAFWNYSIILEFFSDTSERSSLGERTEFIRAGFNMWIDHPIIGVGVGNYGERLPEYTLYQHLFDRSIYEDSRFIANNNIIEFAAEQGAFGLLFYAFMLNRVSKVSHDLFSRKEIILLILLIGFAMPTFFQIIVAALLGTFSAKYRTK
jgi:O-antigen ligase